MDPPIEWADLPKAWVYINWFIPGIVAMEKAGQIELRYKVQNATYPDTRNRWQWKARELTLF